MHENEEYRKKHGKREPGWAMREVERLIEEKDGHEKHDVGMGQNTDSGKSCLVPQVPAGFSV